MAALIPTSAHGGSSPFVGFQAAIFNALNGFDTDGSNVVFDSVQWDTDGFWQSDHAHGVIPAGKGGIYAISLFLYIDDAAGITYVNTPIPSGTPDTEYNGFDAFFLKGVAPGEGWTGSHTFYGRYADGDQVQINVGWTFPGGPPTLHLGSGGYLTMVRLGDLPT